MNDSEPEAGAPEAGAENPIPDGSPDPELEGLGPDESDPASEPPGTTRPPILPAFSPLSRAAALARARPSLTVFAFGLLVFAGGLMSLVGSQIRTGLDSFPPAGEQVEPGLIRVGPEPGEAVGPYLQRKSSTLTERARSDPDEPTLALVTFHEYLRSEQVDALLGRFGLDAIAVQVRVPVSGFRPEVVLLDGIDLSGVVGGMRAEVARELQVLESLAAGVDDPSYRAVYEQDIDLRNQALARLVTDGSAVYGVVVRSTHALLAGVAGAPEVRLVDLPHDPTVGLAEASFAALIPEDHSVATFGVE